MIRTGMIRTGMIRTGMIRTGMIRTGVIRTGMIVVLASLASHVLAVAPPATQPSLATVSKFTSLRLAQDLEAHRDSDPIGYLMLDMSDATELLARLNTSVPVQPRQAKLLGRLDELIALLEKQQSSGGGGGANPNKPMGDSVIAKGPGGSGPMHDPKSGTRTWGQLPPKQREQILQSQNEGFPPGFESILSSYYKRLAQENVAADDNAGVAAPSTQPDR